MLGRHGSIVIPQNTPYAEEMRKHEAHYTEFGPPGRPYVYAEFPKRVYKAIRLDKGGIDYEGYTVNDETERANMRSRGYLDSQTEALEGLEREQAEHGKLAAERNYDVKNRLSERAASEVRAAEAAYGSQHLPSVPETPVRRPGRPRKTVLATE